MSNGLNRRASVDRLAETIKPTLMDIKRAVRDPKKMEWFRGQVHKAAEYVEWRTQEERRRKEERQKHARLILEDQAKGGNRYTNPKKLPDPDTAILREWEWDHEVVEAEGRSTAEGLADSPQGEDGHGSPVGPLPASFVQRGGTVNGWFRWALCHPPEPMKNTPAGSATMLALLHDACSIDVLQPYSRNRIVVREEDQQALREEETLIVVGLAKRVSDGEGAKVAAEIAERWEEVSAEMGRELERRAGEDALSSNELVAGAAAARGTGAAGVSGLIDSTEGVIHASSGGDAVRGTGERRRGRPSVSKTEAGKREKLVDQSNRAEEAGRGDVADESGYVETPADPSAYVPVADIVSAHAPADMSLNVKGVSAILTDFANSHVRWTRPRDKLGKPIANRRSAHLADWAAFLKRRTGTDADGFPRMSESEIDVRKEAVRRAKQRGK